MKTLRWSCVIAIAWLFVLLNLEKLHGPLGIAPFVYTLAGISALLVIILPAAQRIPLPCLLLLPLLLYLASKMWMGYGITGRSWVVTVTEICVIELTLMLARGLAQSLAGVQRVMASLLIDRKDSSSPFDVGEGQMFREIRRARRYERPLTLMAIAAEKGLTSATFDHLFEQLQRENIEKYATTQIARLLTEQTSDCDLIAQRGDHFVALLPESGREGASKLARRIQAAAASRLGLTLRVGLSSFPDQEVTFESLLDRAEREMRLPTPSAPDGGGVLVVQGRPERGPRAHGTA